MRRRRAPHMRGQSVFPGDAGDTGDNRRKPRLSACPRWWGHTGDTGDTCRAGGGASPFGVKARREARGQAAFECAEIAVIYLAPLGATLTPLAPQKRPQTPPSIRDYGTLYSPTVRGVTLG